MNSPVQNALEGTLYSIYLYSQLLQVTVRLQKIVYTFS